ncbi:hypothetical protein PanWU01x14_180820 [Parasponia andersonii]|uniref:Uncharacterized protein n=1 Tax=Parasponia andersonii TaxID=3476 RepID=A0A2P5C6A3_PARAD|nr:hypothetical protein PanWU01x14_180820 [Parasponia andersonii]
MERANGVDFGAALGLRKGNSWAFKVFKCVEYLGLSSTALLGHLNQYLEKWVRCALTRQMLGRSRHRRKPSMPGTTFISLSMSSFPFIFNGPLNLTFQLVN